MGCPGARPRYFEGDLEALEVHARVFSAADLAGRAAAGPPMPEDVPSIEVADDGLLIWRDGAYALGARTIEARGIAPAAALAGPWQVAFPPNLGAPAAITLDRLGSLHRHDDFGVRHFAGTATWRTRFAVAAGALGGDQRVDHDSGRVEVVDRKTVVEGTMGSVRVCLGGVRVIKKKKRHTIENKTIL